MSLFFDKICAAKPYVIAEIGVNHGGDLEKAKQLILLAKDGGAHAAKFQTYKAEKIASKYSPSYWDTSKEKSKSQFDLFKKYDSFGPDEYKLLAEFCRKTEIDFLSTPFDHEAIDFLDPLMEAYKIASADITNTPFLRKIGSKSKPVILSTGAANISEIDTAIDILTKAGTKEIILLHCVLNYPTPDKNAHLEMICGLKHSYPQLLIGYSDHTVPDSFMTALVTAYLLGAMVIEKHFTYDKSLPGNDHYHSMDSGDCRVFIEACNKINELRGDLFYKSALRDEKPAREHARRSIVTRVAIKEGEIITEEKITYKRPAHGISPLYWDEVIGKYTTKDIEEDEPLQWGDLT